MIQTVNDLRNALMFDMETDSDLAACEANCEIADYALESVLTEYRDGNIGLAALEAADAAAGAADTKWYIKLKNGIVNFVKAAAQTIRQLFTRLQNFVTRQKALAAAKKLDKRDPNSKVLSVNIDESLAKALNAGFTVNPSQKIVEVVKAAKSNGNVIEVKDTDFFNPGDATGTKFAVEPGKAKEYLNGVAKALQDLNKSFAKTDEIMKELGNEADTTKKSLVRRAITACYNAMSSAARKYFHAASAIANDLCKKDKTVDKEIEKANKSDEKFTKKSTDEFSKKPSEFKSEKAANKASEKGQKFAEKAKAARTVADKYNLKK